MTLLSQRGPTRQRKDNTMTCNVFSRAANAADDLIYRLVDRLSGNYARRARLHRRLYELTNLIRRQKLEDKIAFANQQLGHIPYGHRLHLRNEAKQHQVKV